MDQHDFGAGYLKLIRYFQENNPNVKIICVSSFWNQPRTAKIISDVCAKNGFPLVEIYKLSEDLTNTAWGNFANPAEGSHPSDKGMLPIADSIWNRVEKFCGPFLIIKNSLTSGSYQIQHVVGTSTSLEIASSYLLAKTSSL